MINEGVKKYCKDDISLIENYDKAVKDKEQTWDCHHRRELETSRKDLIKIGEYFNRPARELIFLTHSVHRALHNKGNKYRLGKHHNDETRRKISIANKGIKRKSLTEETKQKIAESLKGKTTWNKGKHHSEETKQKMSDAMKGLHWFNNGIINTRAKSCPEGFVKGMIKEDLSLRC